MTRINTNVGSLVGRNNLARANDSLSQSLTRLSTGLRINTGADDPAGLIASENLRSDITSIERAISNTDRANQVIATADSSLGQVSSLLNDIRGLVTESANAGALSDEQIAANQLQVDSSLEALNRIAQTTTFQGRRLLDGSLDFLTSSNDSDFANVSNLQIDQANLGATGSVAVDIEVTTAATQAQVDIENIPAGSALSTATAGLDFTLNQAATAGSVTGGGTFTVDVPTQQSSLAAVSLTNGDIAVDAVAGQALDGTAGNIDITITDGGDGFTPTAVLAAGTLTVTIDADTTTLAAVETLIEGGGTGFASGDLAVTLTGAGGAITAGDVTTFGTQSLTGGAAAQADQTSTLSATTAAGENFDIAFAIGDNGVSGDFVLTGDATNGYTVTIDDGADSDLNTLASFINTNVGEIADAAFTSNLQFDATESDNATFTNTVNITGGVAAGAVGTLALDVATTANSTEFNAFTFSVTEITNPGDATDNTVVAAVDNANNEIDLTITGTVTGQQIVDAINGLNDSNGDTAFTATLDTANSTGGFTLAGTSFAEGTDSVAGSTTAFAGGSSGGGLVNAVVFELAGANGAEVLSFGAGTSIADLVAGIELVSDATGVSANANGQTLELISSDFGTDAFVDISVIEDDADLFTDGRDAGSDIVANVNGVSATGNGNELTINTATLDLTATIDSTFTGTASFTITGGGALFQLGPDVVSNQQARLGIGSVNTARLGGETGNLFQLGTGGTASLSTDATTAAAIVEEAIDQVTSLRGRLGAFQRTTLETNRNALNDTLTNLTEAESSIRDADFA
ncbi:MAG: flagellin, partial [Planctomycetota bacterium]